MNSCLNYTENCDNATMCPCLDYKCKYTDEELIEKLKVSPHINNTTYPHVCRCDMDVSNVEVKIDNKPNPSMPKDYDKLKIINHPKHIVVNGALYEKIDDAVITIASGYYEV